MKSPAPGLGHACWNSRLATHIAVVALALAGIAQAAQFPASPGVTHKVRVTDAQVGKQILAKGGSLIADYGSFQLYEVPEIAGTLSLRPAGEVHDEYNAIELNTGSLDTTQPGVKALRNSLTTFTGHHLHLVQYAGPILPEWRTSLESTGVKVISYIPQNAYLVYGDAEAISRLQALASITPQVQWEGDYLDDYKIHPAAKTVDKIGLARNVGTDNFAIQLVDDPEANSDTLQLIANLSLEPIARQEYVLQYMNIVARLPAEGLAQIAARPDVVSVQPYFKPIMMGERQDQIVAGNLSGNVPLAAGYLSWLSGKGFTQAQFDASSFVVDVSDSGIDNGTASPNHFGLRRGGVIGGNSRVVYNRLEGSPNESSTLKGCDGHGTINAHIIGGYDNVSGFPHTDTAGYHYGLGVCPYVKLGSSVVFDPGFTFPVAANLQSRAYQNGARISSNSWGHDSQGAYDMDCQTYDTLVRDAQPSGAAVAIGGNQEMVIVFAAGNAGPTNSTVGSPGAAKNVITVGAAESVEPFGGSDNSGIGDGGADSANDIISFSSRGPCKDGRHKPDIMAPGTHITGGVAQSASPSANGTADTCFDGTDVSGGPGSIFFPDGQQFFTASSGTSQATPAIAGGCALVRQYFINNFSTIPSAAMTKAYLINSARYMNGAGANDNLWSDSQGMGEMNLGTAFDGAPRMMADQLATNLFTASGQSRTFTGQIYDTSKPFRVTVAWTDAPGNTVGNAYNNDLDLTVTVGGTTYKGNVFSAGRSVAGGVTDGKNNVENVFLPSGSAGLYTVTVTAANITSDGVPGNTNTMDQDFAMVVYNGTLPGPAKASAGSATLVSENCAPANSVIDPNETVTVNFSLLNFGGMDTSNLVATLVPTGGVVSPSAPQTYGTIPPGGTAVSKPFTFTASGACGGIVTASLVLTNAGTNFGTIKYTLQLGQLISTTLFSQNFDGQTNGLPPGWSSTKTGSALAWSIVNYGDASSGSVYSPSAPNAGESDLVSPFIFINTTTAQLTYRTLYDTEPMGDGGVLEISIAGAPFTDILAAGGAFVVGGYNMTLTNSSDNPLSGRQAWSGNSGGFITTTVTLPASALNKAVQFKWRNGSNIGVVGGGWLIDSITLTDGGVYACCTGLPAAAIVRPEIAGGVFRFSFQTIPGQPYTIEYKDETSGGGWIPFKSLTGDGTMVTITNTMAMPQRYYRVRSP